MSDSSVKSLLKMRGHEYKEGKYDKAVLAVGSTEYHGEHLPYGTDTLISEHFAREVSTRTKGLLMLPTLPIGMSAHYSSFPLAITLKTDTLMRVLTEVFESLNRHGLKRLLIINGHDGNIPAIEAATNEYRSSHPEFKIAVLDAWWVTAGQLVPEGTFEVWDGLGHGGEGETSMMLRVDPSLVDMKKAKGVVPDLPSHVQYKWTFDEITPYGVTGDPTKATPEKGRLMNDALVELLVDFIEKMDENNWELKDINH
ncbi:MAG: creatininase family protein [Candidatus Bathyarchaeota archaeon]|nr:creatininase family protein [Candidatus Bathyarchaeota archaeon]